MTAQFLAYPITNGPSADKILRYFNCVYPENSGKWAPIGFVVHKDAKEMMIRPGGKEEELAVVLTGFIRKDKRGERWEFQGHVWKDEKSRVHGEYNSHDRTGWIELFPVVEILQVENITNPEEAPQAIHYKHHGPGDAYVTFKDGGKEETLRLNVNGIRVTRDTAESQSFPQVFLYTFRVLNATQMARITWEIEWDFKNNKGRVFY